MAITINVQAVPASGGGNNTTPPNQPTQPTQPAQPTQPTPTPQPTPPTQPQPIGGQNNSSDSIPFTVTQGAPTQSASPQPTSPTPPPTQSTDGQDNSSAPPTQPTQIIKYQRPDFNQYRATVPQQQQQNLLPTSDRMVNDVRAEITRRGVILVPGTQNFATMLNTMRQQQHSNLMGQIDSVHDARIQDIDKRDAALYTEIKARLDASRQSELAGVVDPLQIRNINERYDRLEDREFKRAGQFFEGEYAQVEADRSAQKAEAEQRLTEALQRLTEELSQGNKDSYLNQLRDKYKTATWQRDNAATEEEAREASREAAKIQERMQRAMNPGASPNMTRWLGALGTVATTAINTGIQFDRLGIQDDYVGLSMASSVLNGNAMAAKRQENAIKEQRNSTLLGGIGTAGGAAAGALIGSAFGGVGAIPGWAIGTLVGTLFGTGVGALGSHLANRSMFVEDERTKVADLWQQEEKRMMGYNNLVMLTRGDVTDINGARNWYINQATDSLVGKSSSYYSNKNNRLRYPFAPQEGGLDIYDLGYTAPEFAEQASRRIKQRGYVAQDSVENALEADALERVYSMNSGALGQLSQYDRFSYRNRKGNLVRNNANQDFTNLAYTLDELGTTGMSAGHWARSDEFAGYMSQLQGQQRSTFLTVNNERAARQVATGQAMFGDKFGREAMQGIQQVNDRIQNPTGGFGQTLLYDVIQEKVPETRGRIDKIEQVQYGYLHPEKQDEIQREYQKRIQEIYGGVDTTSGYLAAQELWGIKNPNIMMPIVKQLSKGGLEAKALKTDNKAEDVASVLNNGYTPEVTQQMNLMADKQMRSLLNYQADIVKVVKDILKTIENDVYEKLQEAVDNLKDS